MKPRSILLTAFALLLLTPLAVGLIRGLGPLLIEFPPLTRYVDHAPFSAPVFFAFSLITLLALALFIRPQWFGFRVDSPPPRIHGARRPFPAWGWLGIALTIASWICAWGRFDGLGWFRDHTFFPLWLGYIFTVDGWVYARTGTSRFAHARRQFLALFPASAAAWWYFEYLNRFVQNWWYQGVDTFSALHYILMATFSFSTVFPALFGTYDLLRSFPWFDRAYRNGPAIGPWSRRSQWTLAAFGVLSLALMARFPVPLFFLTWLAPLLIIAPALALAGLSTPFHDLARGDYRMLIAFAVAALVCGFFWECWNYWSMPKWHYSVPYVQALLLFEMPAPGYGGYLPFGPMCSCLWLGMQYLTRPSSS